MIRSAVPVRIWAEAHRIIADPVYYFRRLRIRVGWAALDALAYDEEPRRLSMSVS